MNATKIPYTGSESTAHLDGQAADTVTLEGSAEKFYEWSTRERRAMDLELRARVISGCPNLGLGTTPIVRWRIEYGHGDFTWALPMPAQKIISGDPNQLPFLPGRGLWLRLSARRLRIYFVGPLTKAGADQSGTKVAVSVQPARAQLQGQRVQYATAGGVVQPFPIEATEFRCRNPVNMQPFAAAGAAIEFISMFGELLATSDVFAGGFNDWQPIPALAVTLVASVPMQIDFR